MLEIILSDFTTKVQFDPSNPRELFEKIVTKILIPFYAETNDWNESIRKAVKELDFIQMRYKMPKGIDYQIELLHEIESHLRSSIADIKGVDRIEILFLNMDDYIAEINDIMKIPVVEGDHESKMKRLHTLGDLIASLNTFEISELLNYYIEKACQG
ncbi:MAG: hypothetical protein EU530_09545 [Promethearchaeota archaeon]|nr:MAG: hypothetical protein EU530_09545 [Candidatus Lokiarchaeota archaeon]